MTGSKCIGKYEIIDEIGRGGFAVVYKARDTGLDRTVALKVLHPYWTADSSFAARFRREARAAARLQHPHIVTVYDAGEVEGQLFIAMEHLPGRTLRALLEAAGALSLERVLPILEQVAEALDYAHGHGIVHRDVKPSNMMVEETKQGVQATLMDFGLVKAMSGSSVLTSQGTLLGSPEYMAPEQADPERAGEIGPAADRYALGIVAYQMLTGRVPFPGNTPATLNAHEHKPVPPPCSLRPELSKAVETALLKMLAKAPADRFAAARTFVARLRKALLAERETGQQEAQMAPLYDRSQAAAVQEGWAEARGITYRGVLQRIVGAREQSRHPRHRTTPTRAWIAGGVMTLILLAVLVGLGLRWPTDTPISTSPPLDTLTPELLSISVPSVIGRPVEEARTMVERAGLRLVVREEREEPGAERGVVLEQEPSPADLAPLDSDVSVVVNRPARELKMPGVVGYPVEIVQDGLESDGLRVQIEEVWSEEPKGWVLAQEPGRGATIYAGDMVTLTVSGGVDVPIPLEANLAGMVMLDRAELRQETFQPGEVIAVTLRWRVLSATDVSYVVFVYLMGPDGRLVAQQDVEPIRPTTAWVPGMEVVDPHQVTIPAGQPTGRYQLRTGMYPKGKPGSRLPVVDAGLTTAESDSILIAQIIVMQ